MLRFCYFAEMGTIAAFARKVDLLRWPQEPAQPNKTKQNKAASSEQTLSALAEALALRVLATKSLLRRSLSFSLTLALPRLFNFLSYSPSAETSSFSCVYVPSSTLDPTLPPSFSNYKLQNNSDQILRQVFETASD